MKWISSIFSVFLRLFTSGKARQAATEVAALLPVALPYIDIAAKIVTGITPTALDDRALALIEGKYPQLFDGSIKDPETLKLYALSVGADLLIAKYPGTSTSVARSAMQLAYLGRKVA